MLNLDNNRLLDDLLVHGCANTKVRWEHVTFLLNNSRIILLNHPENFFSRT